MRVPAAVGSGDGGGGGVSVCGGRGSRLTDIRTFRSDLCIGYVMRVCVCAQICSAVAGDGPSHGRRFRCNRCHGIFGWHTVHICMYICENAMLFMIVLSESIQSVFFTGRIFLFAFDSLVHHWHTVKMSCHFVGDHVGYCVTFGSVCCTRSENELRFPWIHDDFPISQLTLLFRLLVKIPSYGSSTKCIWNDDCYITYF